MHFILINSKNLQIAHTASFQSLLFFPPSPKIHFVLSHHTDVLLVWSDYLTCNRNTMQNFIASDHCILTPFCCFFKFLFNLCTVIIVLYFKVMLRISNMFILMIIWLIRSVLFQLKAVVFHPSAFFQVSEIYIWMTKWPFCSTPGCSWCLLL